MSRPALSRTQQLRADELAKQFLGPFSATQDRRRCELIAAGLVQSAAVEPVHCGPRRLARDMRQVSRKCQLLATTIDEVNKTHSSLRWYLMNVVGVDLDALVNHVRTGGAAMLSASEWADSCLHGLERKGRAGSWDVLVKKNLLVNAALALKERRKPNGLTRRGKLASFAAQLWNCANGTNLDAEAFDYAIDELRRQGRTRDGLPSTEMPTEHRNRLKSRPRRRPA